MSPSLSYPSKIVPWWGCSQRGRRAAHACLLALRQPCCSRNGISSQTPLPLSCHAAVPQPDEAQSAAHQSQRYLNTYSFKVVGGKEGVFVLGFWKRKGVCRVHKERSLEMEALFSPSIERVRTGGRRRSKTALWFSPQECPPQELDLQDETEAWWHSPHPQGWSKPSDLLKDEFRDAWQSREFVTRTLAGMGFPSRVAEKDQIPR